MELTRDNYSLYFLPCHTLASAMLYFDNATQVFSTVL